MKNRNALQFIINALLVTTFLAATLGLAQAQQKKSHDDVDLHIGACTLVGYPPQPGSEGGISPGYLAELYYLHNEGLDVRFSRAETVSLLQTPQHVRLESAAEGRSYKYYPDPDYHSDLPSYAHNKDSFKIDNVSFLVEFEGTKIRVDTRIAVMNGVPDFYEDNPRDKENYKKLCPGGDYWKIS